MTPLTRPVLLLLLGVVVYVTAVVVVVVQLRSVELVSLVTFGTYLIVGGLIVVRRGNTIGLLLVAYGSLWGLVLAGLVTAERLDDAGRADAAAWVALGAAVCAAPATWLIAAMWLIFPDGRTHNTTDRRLLRVSGALAALLTFTSVLATPQVLPETEAYPHPFVDDRLAETVYDVNGALFVVMFFFGYFAAARLVVRMRHGDPIERRQVGWIAVGVIGSVTILLANVAIAPLGTEDRSFLLIDSVAVVLIPLTVGVAILRYRLYEIDAIISKSVTYLGLAVVIVGLYAAVVVVPLLIIGVPDEGGPGLVLPIVASAMVAVLFEPIRSRLQRAANRMVYGDRASPHEVLSQVTSSLPAATAGDGTGDLARLLGRGTGAERAVVWVAGGDMLQASGVFPDADESVVAPVVLEDLVDDEFSESRPVLHRGELFGALTIIKPRNDPMTPADRQLLGDVAAGSGLLLRNIGLNTQLARRAADVRASRRRLIAARDAERHRLERDLHDGAQQQVVALKVKLGIARTIAQREEADEIVTRVASLAEETQQAVDALRTVAHGIYPPLLESEGLEAALRAFERTSPIRLHLSIDELGRYGRDAEATVYFGVLETVERARMSGASGIRVAVVASAADLVVRLDIGDRIVDLDLTSVTDRIGAYGGTTTVERGAHGETVITSILPLSETILEPA